MKLVKLFKIFVFILSPLLYLMAPSFSQAQSGPGNLSGGVVCESGAATALLALTRLTVGVSDCAANAQESLAQAGSEGVNTATFSEYRCASAIVGFKLGMASLRQVPQLNTFATRLEQIHSDARAAIQTNRQNPALAGRRNIPARVIRQVPPRSRLATSGFARRVSRVVNLADRAITARTAVTAVTVSAIVQGFLGGAGECDVDNSPIPLRLEENGQCTVNLEATEALFNMLANPAQSADYAARNPEFCNHLEQLNAYLIQEMFQSFPMLSGDITLGPTCRVVGSDYTYDLQTRSSGSQFATNSQYQITRQGGQITVLDSSSGVQQTYIATLDPSDDSVIQSLQASGNGGTSEIDLSINNSNEDQRLLINRIQSIVNMDNAFYGSAVRHCCQASGSHGSECNELGLRPSGAPSGDEEEGPVAQ